MRRNTISSKAGHKERGFTLVEVMAALFVFSIAIVGLTSAGTQSTRALAAIEEKTLAGIVADNQLVLARVGRFEIGTQTGETEVLSRRFNYRLETTASEFSGFFRMVVTVERSSSEGQDAQVLVERVTFRARD